MSAEACQKPDLQRIPAPTPRGSRLSASRAPWPGSRWIRQRSDERLATPIQPRGEYAFINVDPATYTVKVTMQGFKTVENKGVRIGTQQFVTLDFALEVGNLAESVTVESQATPLETSNASVSSNLDSATLQTLPTAGRNPFFLATITPGVTHTGDPQFIRQQDQTNSSLLSLGADRGAATTTRSTGSRSSTCATGPRSSPRSRRWRTSRSRSTPTTRRWGAPAAACSTRPASPARTPGTGASSGRRGRARRGRCRSSPPGVRRWVVREARYILLPLRRLLGGPSEGQDLLLGVFRGY